MKFVKTKFFIVTVCVAVVLVLVPAVLTAFGQTDILRSGLKTVAKPFQWCGTRVADAFDGFISVFKDYDELQRENAELRAALDAIEDEKRENEVLREENEWLKKYLDVSTRNPEFSLLDAKIVAFEGGNYSTVLTLNKGSVHGVKKNMPVITEDGVLGHVTEAGLDWCKVVSIVESTSKVGVYTDRTGVIGMVEGDPDLRAQGKCLMSYEASADIRVGDRVYTSGTGSVYPDGLLLGEIISVEADEATRKLVAVVQPSVDFLELESLEGAMIVLGYNGHTGG